MGTVPVCLSENLTTDPAGRLQLQPWSSVRLVADQIAESTGDTDGVTDNLPELSTLPGRLLIDKRMSWTNDAPIPQGMLVRVTRGPKEWIVSNPNAIQFRDRWTTAVDKTPVPPITTSIFNSQCGSSLDVATNWVAEPNPGVQYMWTDASTADEWVDPVPPGATFELWYRLYVWTPPPWSNNANLNNPQHAAAAHWTRLQLIAHPLADPGFAR
ncbi:hypothetical protein [Mycobacterium sp. SMC-11]|uniref:DUF7172 family protein n=1 Tax=Mycobacterium sp. SMC-11 TaxID=3385969 RepID=UPI00390CB085